MQQKNPYTRSAINHPEPNYQNYHQDDYYYQPQPYYQQSPSSYYQQVQPPPSYYQQTQSSYNQQPQPYPTYYQQPPFYEQTQPIYYDQPYPQYQASLPKHNYADASFKQFSNYYGGDGMITDIEYLDFPYDQTYKKNQLNQRTHNKIINIKQKNKNPVTIFFSILIEQLNQERQMEELKRKLAAAQDFYVPYLFQLFDTNQTQNIVFDEMYQGFQDLGIKVDYNQLQLVYDRFCEINTKDRMSLKEFEYIFQPFGQTQKIQKRYNLLPGPQTKSILNELMRCYQINEQRFENSRAQLIREGIDIQQIYQLMDVNQSRNVGLNEFMNTLNQYSAYRIVPSEAALLFMRFDRSRNGTISLMEFKREMDLRQS